MADPRATYSEYRGFRRYISRPLSEDDSQYAPAINVSKVLQLYVGPMLSREEIRGMADWTSGSHTRCWDNWVYSDINGITNCSDIVYLKAQNMEFSIDVTNKFEEMGIQNVLDKMSSNLSNTGAGNIINHINGGLEMAYDIEKSLGNPNYMGALYIPKFANIQAWTGMEPIKYTFPTFSFQFGQYGLYSARREVVEPIIAICSCFLPIPEEKDEKGHATGHRWQGPIPTARAQLISIFKSLGSQAAGFVNELSKSLVNNASNAFSGSNKNEENDDSSTSDSGGGNILDHIVDKAGSALDKAMEIKDGIYNAFDKANEELLSKDQNKLAYFRLGWGPNAAIMGPFYIKGVKPSFNFQNTDIHGFPTSGSITFEGVTTPLLGNAEDMDIFGLSKPQAESSTPLKPPAPQGPTVTK